MMNIEATIERIFATRQITRSDQQRLMSLFSHNMLTASDKDLIDQIYEALSQGRLRVVD